MYLVKNIYLFWSFCIIFLYSYLPTLFGVSPFIITSFFQGTGLMLGLFLLIELGYNRMLFKNTLCNLMFFIWLLYFLRMLYSYYVDTSLSHTYYLEQDFLKAIIYNIQLGVLIILLPTYSIDVLVKGYFVFYKCLFYFLLFSILLILSKQVAVDERADANSYIPTLLFGQYSALIVLCSIFNLVKKVRKGYFFCNKVYILGVIIGFIGISLAASRSPFVSLFISLLVFFVFYQKTKNKIHKFLKFIAIFIVLFLFTFSFSFFTKIIGVFSPVAVERIEKTFTSSGNVDTNGRDLIVIEAFGQFINNPLFGNSIVITEGFSKGYYPHNSFLEIAISTGLCGVLIFFVLIFNGIRSSVFLLRNNFLISIYGLIFIQFFIFSLFSFPLYRHTIFIGGLVLVFSLYEKFNIKKL